MSKFAVTLDTKLLNRTVRVDAKRYSSMRATLDPGGIGQVVCNRRPKTAGEIAAGIKPIHGMYIANILRRDGRDPFQYKETDVAFAQEAMASEVTDALAMAARTSRPQNRRLSQVLHAVAMYLAEAARDLITEGDLTARHPNARKYALKKAALARNGVYTSKYGIPPPVGVATGRFVEKIAGEFRRMSRGVTGRG